MSPESVKRQLCVVSEAAPGSYFGFHTVLSASSGYVSMSRKSLGEAELALGILASALAREALLF